MFNNYQYEKLLYLTLIVAIEKELHLIKFYGTVNISNNKLLTLKAVFAFTYANTSGKTRIIKNIDNTWWKEKLLIIAVTQNPITNESNKKERIDNINKDTLATYIKLPS